MGTRSRRTFLTDLGRATLGAVVLGPVLAGCDDPAAAPTPDGPTWARASFGFVSAWVLVRDGQALVVDTGTGDDVAPIAGALDELGLGWGDVADVLVTHRHDDHVGGAAAVAAEAPDATFHAAMPDLERLRRDVPAAAEVVDGDRLLDVRVVATPGHTAGHVSALAEDVGVLVVGDALVNGVSIGGTTGDGVELSPPEFTSDADVAAASGRLLAGLDYDVALFGHGEPIVDDAAATVADAVG